jgi:glycosyltransferase involved in cell wall biosynthesis
MSTKKRILFFTKDLNRTGAEIILFNIVESLDRSKFDIGIVLMQQGGELVPNLPEDVNLFYLENTFTLFDKIRFHLGEDVMLNRLKKIENEFKSDIWYINTITNAGVLKYSNHFSAYKFLHIHENLFGIGHLSLADTEIILNKVDHYIACSSIIYNQLKCLTQKPCSTITSCIDKNYIDSCLINFTSPSKNKIKIIGSGTICQVKGVEIFVEISKLFDPNNYEFVWIGKWSKTGYSEVLRRNIDSIKNPAIEIKTSISQEEYIHEIGSADLFLSCSREESMGLVMMEAIYCGVPVLATDSGGSYLIVNDQNGKICFDSRPEVLANEVRTLIENRNQFDPLTMRESIEKYDGPLEIQKLEIILSKI